MIALVQRYPGRRGISGLKRLLQKELRAAGITRSELEDAFLAFSRTAVLPRPETNVWLPVGDEWIEADCVWRRQRDVAELDSWSHHSDRTAFRRDRARDRRLWACGWRTVRVTWWDLRDEPDRLADELGRLLA